MEHNVMSFLIIFLMCYNVHMGQAAELILGESPDENMVKDMVPCENDTDCDSYINGLCRNNFCECNGTKFCEDKGETIVTKIGEYCSIKADCNIEHSVCEKNKCACEKGRVEASDNRRCLTSSNQTCIGSPLCNEFVAESISKCIVGNCECEEERQYCRNSANEGKTVKIRPRTTKVIGDDDLPPRKIREVMFSGVFWTYNLFLYLYWNTATDENRRFLRKYVFPSLVLFFRGFTESNIYHIWISELLVLSGMFFRALLL